MRWGTRRKNCTISGGKGDREAERLKRPNRVFFEGSEIQMREGHWRKHLHSFGD